MAETVNNVELDFKYTNTDFKRTYKFTDVATEDLENVKSKIQAYNANIPAADKKVFISDDYNNTDSENIIGEFNGIAAARIIMVTETKLT